MIRPWSAYADMTAAMVLFGSMVVVSKILTAALPVLLGSSLRLAIAATVLCPLLLWNRPRWTALRSRDWLYLALVGLTGQVLFYVLMLEGLRHTGAANAGIVLATLPAATAALGMLLLRERPEAKTGLAVLLATGGVAALRAVGPANLSAPDDLVGLGLVSLAVIADALSIVLAKLVSPAVSPLVMSAIVTAMAGLMAAPLGAAEAMSFDLGGIGWAEIAYLIYYGTAATALPSLLWLRGIRQVPSATAGVFTSVLPVSSVALSFLVLGEPPRLSHVVGLACVLGATALISRAKRA